jgi:DNA-binding transcriptional MerR regulator
MVRFASRTDPGGQNIPVGCTVTSLMGIVQLPQKLYLRIGEVARLLGVKPHVIRFWEKEFKVLRPKKSATGQRIFSRKDVERLGLIRDLLYDQGYTIEGARKYLRSKGFVPDEAAEAESSRADSLRDGLLEVRARLVSALETLGNSR